MLCVHTARGSVGCKNRVSGACRTERLTRHILGLGVRLGVGAHGGTGMSVRSCNKFVYAARYTNNPLPLSLSVSLSSLSCTVLFLGFINMRHMKFGMLWVEVFNAIVDYLTVSRRLSTDPWSLNI